MKKRATIFILFLIFSLVIPSVPFSSADEYLINSYITASPTTVIETQQSLLTVYVIDENDSVIDEAFIELNCIEGTFLTNSSTTATGFSNSSGIFQEYWTAPSLDVSTEKLSDVNITADISYQVEGEPSPRTLTVFVLLEVVHFSLELEVITNTTTIHPGDYVNLGITVTRNSVPVEEAEIISISIDEGDLIPKDPSLLTDSDGIFNYTWIVPTDILMTTTYTLFIEANKGFSFGNTTKELVIEVILKNFTATITSSTTSITQGDDLTVTVLVEDEGIPFEGATIQFGTTEGFFVSSGTDTVSGSSNSTGQMTVALNTSDMNIFYGGTDVNITAYIEDPDSLFNPKEVYTIVHVEPLTGTLSFNASLSEETITIGDTVELTVLAEIDATAVENASVQVIATGGTFTLTNTTSISGKTVSNGQVTFVWSSSSMTKIDITQQIQFSISVTLQGYETPDSQVVTLNVLPETDDPLTNTNPEEGIPTNWIIGGSIIGVVVLGAIGAVIVIQIKAKQT